MRSNRRWGIILLLGAAASAACVGARMRQDAKLIEQQIATAREHGAYRCAPKELAKAEAHHEFLNYELDEGDFRRATWHHTAATENIKTALEITDPAECAEKRVIIAEEKTVLIEQTDRDGDGIPDTEDNCPDDPEDFDGYEDEDGCPDLDRDGDGILDENDQCPDEPEDVDTYEDEDGCPDVDNDGDTVLDVDDQCPMVPGDPSNGGCPLADRDGDGIVDDVDQCPDFPEDFDGNEDEDGCPEKEITDSDGDGLMDDVDKCPQKPEDFDNFEDEDGCPEDDNDKDTVLDMVDSCPLDPGPPSNAGCPVTDRDGDTVTDDIDECPDVPGKPPKGCPKRQLVVVTAEKIEIKKKINFETNRAKIKGRISFEILDQVASVFKSNPTIKVVIEGHTDSRGAATYNLRLSDNRAKAVREALIERGVDPGRMEAIGYGESKPIASNKSRKGRASNRRVEFNIVQDKDDTPPPTE